MTGVNIPLLSSLWEAWGINTNSGEAPETKAGMASVRLVQNGGAHPPLATIGYIGETMGQTITCAGDWTPLNKVPAC